MRRLFLSSLIALLAFAGAACSQDEPDDDVDVTATPEADVLLTGRVTLIQSAEDDDFEAPTGVEALSAIVVAPSGDVGADLEGCEDEDGNYTVFITGDTDTEPPSNLVGTNVDIDGEVSDIDNDCVIVADSVEAAAAADTDGGTGGTDDTDGSPAPRVSPADDDDSTASPGPAPEGAITDETPDVGP